MSESFFAPFTAFTKMFDDAGNGTLIKASAIANASILNATMNYVTGQFTVFTLGPVPSTANYVRMVNYTCYQYNVTPAAGVTTTGAGAFSASITVPSVDNGNYAVTAIDTQGNLATATLNTIPEGLTFSVMVLLSTVAVIVCIRYYRKRPKRQKW